MQYHYLTLKELLSLLQSDSTQGLSNKEANSRLKKYGYNKIENNTRTSIFTIFWRQLTNPLIGILLIASSLSLAIGAFGDSIVIDITIFANVLIGFFQEWRAESTAQTLLNYQTKRALVIRSGKSSVIDASMLVPGDLVQLSPGTQVPADMRIIEATQLQIEEAILTGESLPIEKNPTERPRDTALANRSNMAFSGTHIVGGNGIGMIVATGSHTQMGTIASLVNTTEQPLTPLQTKLNRLSWILGTLFVGISVGVAALGLVFQSSVYEFISLAIALSVATVPEGLIITMTVILTIGMQRMFRRKALVRTLLSAETLGSVSVVCTDKTGTLTHGELKLQKIITPIDEIDVIKQNDTMNTTSRHIIKLGLLNNAAQKTESGEIIGNPLDAALYKHAIQSNIDPETTIDEYHLISEIPFSSTTKFMARLYKEGDRQLLIIKGAPEVILPYCQEAPNPSALLRRSTTVQAQQGFRLIALAWKRGTNLSLDDLPRTCTPEALFCFSDPLRSTAAETVKTMQEAGIKVVMVTGDHESTAQAIAQQAGISTENSVDGVQLEKMNDQELNEIVKTTDIFARVAPRDKIRIVKSLQQNGFITAMTGDGINDAPALKAADIGIAQGSGSDIAQSISDMVLLDDNLATIGTAIYEGRVIFDNIRKVLVFLLSDSFSQVVLLGGAFLLRLPLPIYPTQILWLNIIHDGLPGMALAAEPGEKDIMTKPPREHDEPIISTRMGILIFVVGIFTDFILLSVFIYLLHIQTPIAQARTIMFHSMALGAMMYVFATRSLKTSIFGMNPFGNHWLIAAVIFSTTLHFGATAIPHVMQIMHLAHLDSMQWMMVLGFSTTKLIAIELTKLVFTMKKRSWAAS